MFGCATSDYFATAASGFGTEVDEMVGLAKDVEIVFDDDDGIATCDEALEHVHEHFDVFEMETSGWLVEDVEGVARVAFGEFGGEFDALAFATRECCRALSEFDVAEPDVL